MAKTLDIEWVERYELEMHSTDDGTPYVPLPDAEGYYLRQIVQAEDGTGWQVIGWPCGTSNSVILARGATIEEAVADYEEA